MLLVSTALLALGLFALAGGAYSRYRQAEEVQNDTPAAGSPRDATYFIDGEPAILDGGVAELPSAPGAATPTMVTVFSVPAYGDLDGDGVDDAAVLLLKDSGSSGTFFYIAAALRRGDGYEGTNAARLGDRIVPDTTNIWDGVLVHDYYTRNSDEPLTATAEIGMSIYLRYVDGELRETEDGPRP